MASHFVTLGVMPQNGCTRATMVICSAVLLFVRDVKALAPSQVPARADNTRVLPAMSLHAPCQLSLDRQLLDNDIPVGTAQ